MPELRCVTSRSYITVSNQVSPAGLHNGSVCPAAYIMLTAVVLYRRSSQLAPVRRSQAGVWVPDGVASERRRRS